MRYLIDTNIFTKITVDYDVTNNTKDLLEDYENIIYISSESIKEFVHLVQNGKVIPRKEVRSIDIFDFIENILGFKVKYVTKEHLRTFTKLDLVEGHNDPSDRLIIAQAITEKIPLISSDKKFPKYKKMGLDLISNR